MEKAAHRADKTCQEFSYVLPQFAGAVGKRFLDEINSEDLLGFITHLRGLGLGDRTVANKLARIECFLRRFGVVNLLTRYERPRYVKKIVRAYSEDDIRRLPVAFRIVHLSSLLTPSEGASSLPVAYRYRSARSQCPP